ncbi:hypothetical protein BGY98DRAFT_1180592 [Russula aff. rugulosa BPL654]|nr:hypothetical protein BGY98DRAFT_1180592 [Russula aff. rugulosa BPL654]
MPSAEVRECPTFVAVLGRLGSFLSIEAIYACTPPVFPSFLQDDLVIQSKTNFGNSISHTDPRGTAIGLRSHLALFVAPVPQKLQQSGAHKIRAGSLWERILIDGPFRIRIQARFSPNFCLIVHVIFTAYGSAQQSGVSGDTYVPLSSSGNRPQTWEDALVL